MSRDMCGSFSYLVTRNTLKTLHKCDIAENALRPKSITKIPHPNFLEFDPFSRHPKVKFSKFFLLVMIQSLNIMAWYSFL